MSGATLLAQVVATLDGAGVRTAALRFEDRGDQVVIRDGDVDGAWQRRRAFEALFAAGLSCAPYGDRDVYSRG